VSEADADGSVAAIYARVRASVKTVPGMYQVLANAPTLLDGWLELGWSLRQDASSERGLRELAIARVAQITHSDYVWRSHYQMARSSGISAEKLAALEQWSGSDLFDTAERAVLGVTDQLTRDADVTDDVWNTFAGIFDDRQKVELTLTISWYACASRMANGLRVPPEEWHDRVPPLPESG
jgi:alkylhydroperoxidase family enzyme